MRILWTKGYVTYELQGREYVYRTVESRDRAGTNALKHLIEIYFQGSPCALVTALMSMPQASFTHKTLLRLRDLIEKKIASSTKD